MASRVRFCSFIFFFLFASIVVRSASAEFVLTLDASNFSDTVNKHSFIVAEFYAPWCGHCKSLAPEFEKAASILSNHDPPIILAKVDADDEINKGLAGKFKVRGFPTIKILRDGGKSVQEYKGPRNADGIVEYFKKQVGPASYEIKSSEDAGNLITEQKIFVVGIFSELSGEEFANFTILAEKLCSDYDFGHTLDARLLPRGDSTVNQPTIRLFKPFDEFVVDFTDFHVDAMEKFVEEASVPVLTIFNKDPVNRPFVTKFFNNPNVKAMLFMNFNSDNFEVFKSKYHDVAKHYEGKSISFLLGDLKASQSTFEKTDGQKYLKQKLEPDHIAHWLKEYMDGDVKPYTQSEPIPEVNDDPVKVVVADSLHDVVFKSGKNVMLEFYAPWCGHCKRLTPILDEVAVSFGSDEDVVIAKLDATANDIPSDIFDVKGYPTLYFSSASGKIVQYDGNRSKEDIIEFIQKNKDTTIQSTESVKDEL